MRAIILSGFGGLDKKQNSPKLASASNRRRIIASVLHFCGAKSRGARVALEKY